MAQIREELTLLDRFTSSFTNYIGLAQRASGVTSQAQAASGAMGGAMSRAAQLAESSMKQTQAAASDMIAQTSGALQTGGGAISQYAGQIQSVQQKLAQANVEMSLHSQRLAEVAAAQGAASTDAMMLKNELAELVTKSQSLSDRETMLRAALEQVAGGAKKAERALKNYEAGSKKADGATSKLATRIKQMAGAFVGIQGLKALVGLSDAMTQTTARIDMMNDGLQSTKELQSMIYESAQRSRGAYQDTANMVAKLGTLAGDAFSSSGEVVAFAEQINKQMKLSGTTTAGAQAAMLQLTQAMSSGVLRGEELNSILEQAPTIAQSIADYMGVNVGQMRELASQGQVTADVVKNAMFAAADETNEKFESMPMTWSEIWTSIQNTLLVAIEPILEGISWLANHFEQLKPVLVGLAGAALSVAAALGIQAAASWIAAGAAQEFFTKLLGSPITYIALAIGALIVVIYKWVQSMGGLQIAWLTVVDAVLFAWDSLKAGFMTGVYAVMDLFDKLGFKFQSIGVSIANFMGDMKVNVLTILQNMVNGAIDIINGFTDLLNSIFGLSFNAIDHMTFAATAAAENEAAKSARGSELAEARQELENNIAERDEKLTAMWEERDANHAARQAEITAKQAEQMAGESEMDPMASYESFDAIAANTDSIASDVGSIKKSVNMSDEDIKSLVDMAERRYVNNINLTAQTPVINVTGQNTGNTAADRQNLGYIIRDVLIEQAASSAVRPTAVAF